MKILKYFKNNQNVTQRLNKFLEKMAPTALAQHRVATKLQLLKYAISMKKNKTKYAYLDMQSC